MQEISFTIFLEYQEKHLAKRRPEAGDMCAKESLIPSCTLFLFLVRITTFGSRLPPASLCFAAVAFSCKSAFASLGKSAGFFSCSAGSNPPFSKNKKPPFRRFFIFGRDDRIRTCGLCVPNATLYQAEPHPAFHYLIYYNTLFYFFQYFLQLK